MDQFAIFASERGSHFDETCVDACLDGGVLDHALRQPAAMSDAA